MAQMNPMGGMGAGMKPNEKLDEVCKKEAGMLVANFRLFERS